MIYTVLDRRPVPTRGPVLTDEIIQLASPQAADRCPVPLRQVRISDAEKQRSLTFLTNIFHLAASTVAAINKERWQIELFFKTLKQNLKVKTFVGTSENAVQVQIWTALIAMLLLKFLQLKSTWPWSLSNLAALLRFQPADVSRPVGVAGSPVRDSTPRSAGGTVGVGAVTRWTAQGTTSYPNLARSRPIGRFHAVSLRMARLF
jgi:Transposase DDE domain